MEEKFKIYLPWFGIGIAAVIVLFLVIKYVPLDPTKEEVVESSDEEIIHYEESIDRETLEEIVSDSQSDDINRQRENIENEKIFPTFDIIKADDAGVVIAGHAEKYSNVQIFNGDELIGEVQSNRFGEFVFITDIPLEPGTYELRLIANGLRSKETATIIVTDSNIANNIIQESAPSENIPSTNITQESVSPENIPSTNITQESASLENIPSTREAPVENTEDSLLNNSERNSDVLSDSSNLVEAETVEETLIIINDEEGAVERVLQAESNTSEILKLRDGLSFDALTYTPEEYIKLSGKSQPGSRVEVYFEGRRVGWAITDEDGYWSITLEKLVESGDYVLRFNQYIDGQLISSIDTPVTQPDKTIMENINENTYVVQPGNSLWRISRRYYGRGIMYTLIFKANGSQINDPDLIYPGQIFDIPNSAQE